MGRILLWLLPVVDAFNLRRILSYYSSLGVEIPITHARLGMAERWFGYLPAGFLICWFAGPRIALIIVLAAFGMMGLPELYLMSRGFGPWKFFKGKSGSIVAKIFLLEAYNMFGYFLLGVVLAFLSSLS